jgi:hypothetical protein
MARIRKVFYNETESIVCQVWSQTSNSNGRRHEVVDPQPMEDRLLPLCTLTIHII